jgi:hypothetical protein
MTALFDFPLASETLSPPELVDITGAKSAVGQRQWLDANSWQYVLTRAGQPVVGRMNARLRLAGINPATLATAGAWQPDLSNVK